MRRPLLLSFILLSLALPLAAANDVVTVTPLNPREGEVVTVTAEGIWPSGCVPREARVTRTGQTISVVFSTAQGLGGCTAALTPYRISATIGALEVGSYDLVVETLVEIPLINPPFPPMTILRRRLVVAEADPTLIVTPRIASIHGGTEVVIRRADGLPLTPCIGNVCNPVIVRIDGVVVNVTTTTPNAIRLIAPAHGLGGADVTIINTLGNLTTRNAITYFDPAAPLDSATHETILFPLYFNGSGAFGSQWETTIDLRNRNDVPVVPLQPVFPTIPAMATAQIDPRITVRERGVLLHVPRDLTPKLSFAAFARDVSRENDRWGVELPVVREDDFVTELEFPRVPLDFRFRVALRVYTMETAQEAIFLRAFDFAGDRPKGTLSLLTFKRTDVEPGFAILENLGGLFDNGNTRLRLETASGFTRFWAFLTVTNNQTQEVTVITPQ